MKAITPDNFKILLQAAVILTDAQDLDDQDSVDIAFYLWNYTDACRREYPNLKDVHP